MTSAWSARPTEPDRGVLERAEQVLIERGVAGGAVTWQVRQRLERPKSTLFMLEASIGGVRTLWHYKVDVVHIDGQFRPDLHRARQRSLEAEQELAEPLRVAAAGVFGVDRALLIDAERLIAVREHVPGRKLGKAYRWLVPGRRGRASHLYRSVGAAIRIFEEVGDRREAPADGDELGNYLVKAVNASSEQLSRTADGWARSTIEELAPVVAAEGLVWSHGDVSQTNVLISGDRIGIIDLSWTPQLRCWDLVRFLARVECESPRSDRWTTRSVSQVMDGYGLDLSAPTPQWRLAQLLRCLMALRDPSAVVRQHGRDAMLVEMNR